MPRRSSVGLVAMSLAVLVVLSCGENGSEPLPCDNGTRPPCDQDQITVPFSLDISQFTNVGSVVVEITGPDIDPPIVVNLNISSGTASGMLTIPTGSDRTITVRIYDVGGIETHRGSVTIDVVEGSTPSVTVTLQPVTHWVSLAAGGQHTCGLTSDGAAYCWGAGGSGQLGDGSTTYYHLTPVAVVGGITFATLVAGGAHGSDHTCGLTSGGEAYCWGLNRFGQLGDSSTTDRSTPIAVAGGITFVGLTAGVWHTCGLTSDGAAYCWGYNGSGQLGDTSRINVHPTPLPVEGSIAFASLVAGGFHTCGLTGSGAAYCWGENVYGQLGDGSTGGPSDRFPIPMAVAGEITFATLTARGEHTCGLTSDGTAYCWGANVYGQLGNGSGSDQYTPVAVTGGPAFSTLTAGYMHTCGLTDDGAAYCWGQGFYGQLGNGSGSDQYTPVAVTGGITFATLTPGGYHTCGLTSGGSAYCWGQNDFGQLGDGTTAQQTVPVAVANP